MKWDKIITRRKFFKTAGSGVSAGILSASVYLNDASAKAQEEWRLVSAFSKDSLLASGLESFAESIAAASDGRLSIKIYYAGELVKPVEAMDAVADGKAEMGYAVPAYWARKLPATMFLCLMPFGLTAQEKNAWFEYGGGQEIADKVYAELGCKFFPGGSSGAQMGGWFNKEINSISDLEGLKIRIGGPAAAVLKALGAEVVPLPLHEAPKAFKNGEIDALELVGPALDMAAGIHKLAKYYYYPCWQEPGGVLDLFISKTKWDGLNPTLKAVIKGAATCLNYNLLSSNVARNSAALTALVEEHNVRLKQFPNEVLQKFRQVSDEMLHAQAAKDELTGEVLNSIWQFQKQAAAWSKVSLQPYLKARDKA